MDHITIKVPAASASFLISAIQDYSASLIDRIKDGLNTPNWTVSVSDAGDMIAALQDAKQKAPYGLKKDGTPAKQRGRKPTKKVAK